MVRFGFTLKRGSARSRATVVDRKAPLTLKRLPKRTPKLPHLPNRLLCRLRVVPSPSLLPHSQLSSSTTTANTSASRDAVPSPSRTCLPRAPSPSRKPPSRDSNSNLRLQLPVPRMSGAEIGPALKLAPLMINVLTNYTQIANAYKAFFHYKAYVPTSTRKLATEEMFFKSFVRRILLQTTGAKEPDGMLEEMMLSHVSELMKEKLQMATGGDGKIILETIGEVHLPFAGVDCEIPHGRRNC